MAEERSTMKVHVDNPYIHKYDWAYYRELLPYIKGDVLDLGSGAGMFINEYIQKPEVASVLAVDKYTSEIQKNDKLTILTQSLPSHIETDKKFDTIVSTEFVEHIKREELEPFLEEVKRLLKPDGLFIGSTPNKKVPTTNPFHLYEYTLEELLSIYRNFFSEVEAWDNSKQNCTTWTAKI